MSCNHLQGCRRICEGALQASCFSCRSSSTIMHGQDACQQVYFIGQCWRQNGLHIIQVCRELSSLPAESSVLYGAEYKLMLAHLREPGASLSVIPEGIAGIFLQQDPSTEAIFLSKRKGFVRLAIQAGAGEQRFIGLKICWCHECCCRKFKWSLGEMSLFSNSLLSDRQTEGRCGRLWCIQHTVCRALY